MTPKCPRRRNRIGPGRLAPLRARVDSRAGVLARRLRVTLTDPQFESLLQHLKEARGFDFTGYKRSSLVRRVNRRMSQVGARGYGDYLDYLQVHTEEVYSLAILLTELLGPEEFRNRVKVYATDVDEEQLAEARQATYPEEAIESLSPERRERYFEAFGGRYVFRKDLRRSVIFGRNDLVQDAPISRVDLLVCRNTLMYFNAETQARILSRFHFALSNGGVLFLGKAEMLLSHGHLFLPTDLKWRIFRKVPQRLPSPAAFPPDLPEGSPDRGLVGLDRLRNEAFLASPVAQIVVTSDGLVALTNRQAEIVFGISSRDAGRPFRDLEVSYRPAELRRYIEQAQVERRATRVTDVEYTRGVSDTMFLEIHVNPLVDGDGSLLGVTLAFNDVTAARRLHDELEETNRQLESAYEELQSTNEELETTNEELQSTVEELETTNEELQSTNEELETMNEELQSTNDELQVINDTLRDRSAELNELNAFLQSILTGINAGVVVVDRELRILAWNSGAQELWGLRPEEAEGQHLLNLDVGLPMQEVRPIVREALSDASYVQELRLHAVNRRGRSVDLRMVCSSLHSLSGQIR